MENIYFIYSLGLSTVKDTNNLKSVTTGFNKNISIWKNFPSISEINLVLCKKVLQTTSTSFSSACQGLLVSEINSRGTWLTMCTSS